MGFINLAERTINAKLVYYGVGVGGKTTSLQRVHGILCPRNEVQLVSIDTEEESTLLFDFLPINLGTVGGFKIRIQGFTVPGQPKYRRMRKYVLAGADAVVFVVDSQKSRLQENLESLQSMREHLHAEGAGEIPIVVQYNKRDLPDVLSERELDPHFRFRDGIEAFPSVATEGQGVFETFVHAAGLLVASKVRQFGLGRSGGEPDAIADGVRSKLWEICDQVRRERSEVPVDQLPQTQVRIGDGGNGTLAPAAVPSPVSSEPYVLTDAELDIDLAQCTSDAAQQGLSPIVASDHDEHLLDRTVQSNVQLAQRYGQLDEHKNLLERKVRELVEAAQNTAHDLNRPVTALRLLLSTMDKGYLGALPQSAQQAVQNGMQAVQQMERLIRDLLDSSRLDHDGMALQFQPVDLTLVLAQVVGSLRYEIEQRDAHIRIEPMPTVVADEWGLTKVFQNLLGNTLQYAAPDRRPTVQVWAEDLGDEWQICVRDNGIGIPAKDRDRLFRRFERGSNTGGISGTGLGLHIVKEIAQGHGGRVRFDSTEGSGTTFVLHLPKAPKQAPHSPLTETAARADL